MDPTPRRRQSAVAGVAAALATTSCVLTVVLHSRLQSDILAAVERRAPGAIAFAGLVGLAVVAVGIWALLPTRPMAATGLAIATTATLAPLWAAAPSLGAEVRAAAIGVGPAAIPALVLVAAGWRRDAVSRAAWISVALAVVSVGAHLFGYDPFADRGCTRTCLSVSPLLDDVLSTRTVVAVSGAAAIAAAISGVVAMTARSAPDAIRRSAIGGVVVVAAAASVNVLGYEDAQLRHLALLLTPAAVAIVAAIALALEVRAWRTRRTVRGLADQLATATPGTSRSAGIVDVQFAIPGEQRWVDADGRDAEVPAGSRAIAVVDDGGPVLRFVVDHADERDVASSLTPARRLALRNAHLAAVARARLAEVRASQRRVVHATDAERRRIERDLHDGAQQRLVGVAFQLRIARPGLDATSAATVSAAEDDVGRALASLRDLAHGMFPRVLEEEGLVAALEDVAASAVPPATFASGFDGRVDPEVAAAAYATVTEALRHAPGDARPHVSVERDDPSIVVRAVVPGMSRAPAGLVEVSDRVGAVGGTLSVSTEGDALTVEAVMPCAS